ncbi:Homoaconitase [Venturia inaequalis]|nr:Homoaconitase [Venturia inaequalis]
MWRLNAQEIKADSFTDWRCSVREPMSIYATSPGLQPPSSNFMPPGHS